MPTFTRELTINVRDPGRAGLLRSFSSQTTDNSIGTLVRHDSERWGLRLVEPSDGVNFWRDIDLTGASLEIGLGIADLAPTGGTFSLLYPTTIQGLIVSGGGVANGNYLPTGTENGKPFYNLSGQPASGPNEGNNYCIGWGEYGALRWTISTGGSINLCYSANNVATPDLVTLWQDVNTNASVALTVTPPPSSTAGLAGLPATITAAALQTALNANPARAADGPVQVVQEGNSYVISDTTNGARSLLAVMDSTLLVPQSVASVTRVQAGSSTSKEIQVLTLAQADFAYANTFTPYPGAGYTLRVIQTGDATHTSIRQLTLTPAPYDGTWFLQGVPMTSDASASAVQAALGAGYVVTQRDISAPPSYIITQAANGFDNALTIDATGLRVPVGLIVDINLNTYGMLAAFANATAPTISLTLQGRLTLPGQLPFTFLLITAQASRDVLNLGSVLPALLGTYPNPVTLVQVDPSTKALTFPLALDFYAANPPPGSAPALPWSPLVTAIGGTGANALAALSTPAMTLPCLKTILVGGTLQDWMLLAGTDTNSADVDGNAATQRPNDYDGMSNARVWYRKR